MITPTRRARELALPARSLSSLRTALLREAGPLATIHALHSAGYDAGEALFEGFASGLEGPPDQLDDEAFWGRLSSFLQSRGWGSLQHQGPHPGIGVLSSDDWAEADGAEETQPSCSFSAGMLSGLLTKAAGAPVAVLQVTCRARGDEACTFAFGAETTVHDLYGLLLEGSGFDRALSEL